MLRYPCQGCNERHKMCHGKCQEYNDYKTQLDKLKKEEQLRNLTTSKKVFVKRGKPKYLVKNRRGEDY